MLSLCYPSKVFGRSFLQRRVVGLLVTLTVLFLTTGALCFAQEGTQDVNDVVGILPQTAQETSGRETPSYTIKVMTSLVIVEVVARDKEDNPIRDLTAKDLRVSERIADSKELPERIASFRTIDEPVEGTGGTGGIILGWLHKSFCGLAGAYELSYYPSPESRKDGLHRILVTSSRRGLTLYYRTGYRIESDKPVEVRSGELDDKRAKTQLQKSQALEAERRRHPELDLPAIACYDALDVTTFSLGLQQVDSEIGTAYEFLVPASYFESLPVSERGRPTQLDFSLCTFDFGGHPLRHFEGAVEAGANAADYELMSTRGFAHSISFEPQQQAPLALSARLVVRDRNTGALGSGEILFLRMGKDPFPAPIPEGETTTLFGTTTRSTPLALCGDVYQLAPWTMKLPRFSEMDAVAPIYTTSLAVYSRFFTLGIPGVTSRTEWFGINYQGTFGIDVPGKYEFDLLSDDGARVYIDSKLVVSDDTLHSPRGSRGSISLKPGDHDLRVSYFQGPRTEVALVFLVKTPGRAWRLFDTRDFPNSQEPGAHRKKLPVPEE